MRKIISLKPLNLLMLQLQEDSGGERLFQSDFTKEIKSQAILF